MLHLWKWLVPAAVVVAAGLVPVTAEAQDRPVIRNIEDCAQFASRADRQLCAQTFVGENQSGYVDDDDDDDVGAPAGGGGPAMDPDDDEDEDEAKL